MRNETLLHEEIESEFKKLKDMDMGSEDHKATVDSLAKLMDRAIEIDKLNIENEKEIGEKRDRLVRNGIAIAGIIIPTAVTIWGTCKSIEFEKEGTITTIMGRGFINKLLPKK